MFDFGTFLTDKFSTPTELVSFLSSYGAPAPKLEAAVKWFQRKSVPSEWFPLLLVYLEIDQGGPVALASYWRQ